MYCELVGFFIFRYSLANKIWQPKRGKFPN